MFRFIPGRSQPEENVRFQSKALWTATCYSRNKRIRRDVFHDRRGQRIAFRKLTTRTGTAVHAFRRHQKCTTWRNVSFARCNRFFVIFLIFFFCIYYAICVTTPTTLSDAHYPRLLSTCETAKTCRGRLVCGQRCYPFTRRTGANNVRMDVDEIVQTINKYWNNIVPLVRYRNSVASKIIICIWVAKGWDPPWYKLGSDIYNIRLSEFIVLEYGLGFQTYVSF